MANVRSKIDKRLVGVALGRLTLGGNLNLPEDARGAVLFAHGSGSSRNSPRNRHVAEMLNQAGLATLLIDLLSSEEEMIDMRTASLRFDINLLAQEWPRLRIGFCNMLTRSTFALAISVPAPEPPPRSWLQPNDQKWLAPLSHEVVVPIWLVQHWRAFKRPHFSS